jgi:MFS family permease
VATPLITKDLESTATQVLWIGDIYSFVLAALLVTMGSLGDRIGHKKLLLCSATAFAGMSVATAYAPTAELLIAARALLSTRGHSTSRGHSTCRAGQLIIRKLTYPHITFRNCSFSPFGAPRTWFRAGAQRT